MSATVVTCDNPECRVAETGKCVEGLALEKCTRYGRAPAEAVQTAPKAEIVALSSGGRLALTEAPSLLRARDSRVIAVLGARGAGKTSLIASLFGLFQDGPVNGFRFVGSRTLIAFEEACHDARAASKRATPHFERTKLGSFGLYHLTTHSPPQNAATELLLADRAGEEYMEAADSPSLSKSFLEVRHADVLTLLVDGSRLLDLRERHNLRNELELMLQALRDGHALGEGQRLAIALTKLDEVEGSSNKAQAESDFANLVASISRLFANAFVSIEPFRLAASPTSDVLPRGHGVSALLGFWMRAKVPRTVTVHAATPPTRAFGRLTPSLR